MSETTAKSRLIQVPIMFSVALLQALDHQAQREGLYRGRSILVRRAVTEYLQRHTEPQDAHSVEVQ